MIFLVILIVENVLLYALPFALALLIINLLSETKQSSRIRWLQNLRGRLALVAFFVIAAGIVWPVSVNIALHRSRAELWQGDRAWTSQLHDVHRPALLFRPDAIWTRFRSGRVQDVAELKTWRSLLLTHVVDAVLVGLPPEFGKNLDPASPLIRYGLEQRSWCPPVLSITGYEAPGLDELFQMAVGHCVVGASATLADADAVLSVQLMPDNDIPASYSARTLMANRLSLYQRENDA